MYWIPKIGHWKVRSVDEIGLDSVSEGFIDTSFTDGEELIDYLEKKRVFTFWQKIFRKA